ncbi:Alcohol acetyltransferase [Ilyonectria robusta]
MEQNTRMAESRPLGPLEKYSVCRSQLHIYRNVCVTASYLTNNDEELIPALFRALGIVVEEHPILSATLVDAEKKPRFVRLDSVDLERIVTFLDYADKVPVPGDASLDVILERQHNVSFKYDEPTSVLWRLAVLYSLKDRSEFTVCLCFHHSIMDTKSALVFHHHLEAALYSPSTNGCTTIVESSKKPLLPPMEAVFQPKLSCGVLRNLQNPDQPPEAAWSGAVQTTPVHTRFSSLVLSPALIAGLKRQCDLHSVSLTALLMSITANAFFQVLPSEYTFLWGDCAVSLRPFLSSSITERSLGCYVGSFSERFERFNVSIWDDSKRTKSTIDNLRKTNGKDMPVTFLQEVSDMCDMREWLSEKMGKRRWAAWELSNVGTLAQAGAPERAKCQIKTLLFSQSASACSGAIKISVATGRDQRMTLGFSWQEDVVEKPIVAELIQEMNRLVIQTANKC